MKLATSTGDFAWYTVDAVEEIANFVGGKFKYINMEQPTGQPEFFADGDAWKGLAEKWGNAAAKAGVKLVVSHAPCLHKPILNDEETYQRNIRALRRSIEIARMLDIGRIVVHACSVEGFTKADFYQYNTRFYNDLLPTAEENFRPADDRKLGCGLFADIHRTADA